MRSLSVHMMGRMAYREAWTLQQALAERRKAGQIPDTLLLLEHEPVVTLGRDGSRKSLVAPPETFAQRGVEVVESDRGGDATFHGPGQLIAYPIIDLKPDRKDIRRYVQTLENIMIQVLDNYDIVAGRLPGEPGVWCFGPDRKIGAIGARVSRWVTHHGFALNVTTDLSFFELIVPCGIADKGVTSLQQELARRVSMVEVMECVVHAFAKHFDCAPTVQHGAPTLGRVDEVTTR
ncbi:MAG: lipoyl(octanoyl) transferase LipB [Myxococcota bacterium]|nr:lipoyl(octanoyl) transferase LipB [Myxococcota bacterium]